MQGQRLSLAAACLLYDSDSLWSSRKLQTTAALPRIAAEWVGYSRVLMWPVIVFYFECFLYFLAPILSYRDKAT